MNILTVIGVIACAALLMFVVALLSGNRIMAILSIAILSAALFYVVCHDNPKILQPVKDFFSILTAALRPH